MTKVGGGRQYLVIDLATEQWDVHLIPNSIIETHIGGESLGLHLWKVYAKGVTKPTDEPLCFVTGALAGSDAICSSTMTLVGRSASTHLVETSTKRTNFSSTMVSCGWRAIILLGMARRQMTLHISCDDVQFKPSEKLIGKQTGEVESLLGEGTRSSVVCIGPAGEHGSVHASLVHEGRPLDRFGFGASLGGKHIKALVVTEGPVSYLPANGELYAAAKDRIHRLLDTSNYVKEYARSGPLVLLDKAKKRGFAAVNNMSRRTDPRLFHLGGDECARRFALESIAFEKCPVDCDRNVMRAGGQDTLLPNALEMMALGSNIGNYDPSLVMQWRSKCVDLGLDPIATGMIIGELMDSQTDKVPKDGFSLTFGDTEQVPRVIELLGRNLVSDGNSRDEVAASKRSSKSYQVLGCDVNGWQMPPFDPRGAWGQALCSGLREDFPLVLESVFNRSRASNVKSRARFVVQQENFLAMMRSLGLCDDLMIPLVFEAGYLHTMLNKIGRDGNIKVCADLISGFFGIGFSTTQVLAAGRRAIVLKRIINGEDAYPIKVPLRFTIDPESNHGSPSTVPFKQLEDRYRLLRALDIGVLYGEEGMSE